MTILPQANGRSFLARVHRKVRGGLEHFGASSYAGTDLLQERWVEATGGHPYSVDDGPHLREALAWLARAQDAGQGGIARGYSLARVPGIGPRGWQAAYPETTGYIIPTLYAAAWIEDRPDLAERATRAAYWELTVQQESGALPAGMVGQGTAPAVFNTGQVIFGWLCAFQETGDPAFADAVYRAAGWLCREQDSDGTWRRGNSPFADPGATRYNARTAWALVAAGHRLGRPDFTAAGARALHAVKGVQLENGWFPECCLDDPARPLTHTLAYTVQGLLEGGLLLGDPELVASAVRAARSLTTVLGLDGHLPGRLDSDWRPATTWSCLTGSAQMAVIWSRIDEHDPDVAWRAAAGAAIGFLKRTQNRTAADPGLRGGIKGSAPVTGAYGRHQVLSWATKFLVDGLLRRRLPADESRRTAALACLALA